MLHVHTYGSLLMSHLTPALWPSSLHLVLLYAQLENNKKGRISVEMDCPKRMMCSNEAQR